MYVEFYIFVNTPDAQLAYTLMCDCYLNYRHFNYLFYSRIADCDYFDEWTIDVHSNFRIQNFLSFSHFIVAIDLFRKKVIQRHADASATRNVTYHLVTMTLTDRVELAST